MVIEIPTEVRALLRGSLLDETDLREALRHAPREPVAGSAGHQRALATLTVRRPLDPETSELRKVEVLLRPTAEGFEVYAVKGLEPLV